MSTSPLRRKARSVSSSWRPSLLVPERFSSRMIVQPAAVSASPWMVKSCSPVGDELMPAGIKATVVAAPACAAWHAFAIHRPMTRP